MRGASFAQAASWSARIGVAKLPNLGVSIDAKAFKVAVAFRLASYHDTAYAAEVLFNGQDCGDRSGGVPISILPVCLNVALPCTIQVGERDKPAPKRLPAP